MIRVELLEGIFFLMSAGEWELESGTETEIEDTLVFEIVGKLRRYIKDIENNLEISGDEPFPDLVVAREVALQLNGKVMDDGIAGALESHVRERIY